MFIKMIGYKLLINAKVKEVFFWCLLFPIILATFFNVCIGNIYNTKTKEDVIKIAVVNNGEDNTFVETLKNIKMFDVKELDSKKAEKEKKAGKVCAIVEIDNDKATVKINDNGISETIVKSTVDTISQTHSAINNIYSINNKADINKLVKDISSQNSYTELSKDSQNVNPVTVFFFALIAMTILFSMNNGLYTISNIQANKSDVGARNCISSRPKDSIFCSYFIADFITQFTTVILLLLYIKFVLKFDIGAINAKMICLCIVSIFMALSLGTILGTLKISNNNKSALCTAFTLLSCGLSGLFMSNIKPIIEDKAPVISYINPATVISDGLLSQYYYNSNQMYFRCILTMLVIGIIFFTITCAVIRRQRYASI